MRTPCVDQKGLIDGLRVVGKLPVTGLYDLDPEVEPVPKEELFRSADKALATWLKSVSSTGSPVTDLAMDAVVAEEVAAHWLVGPLDVAALNEDRLVVMMRPCKNMQTLYGKSVPLVIGAGGRYVIGRA